MKYCMVRPDLYHRQTQAISTYYILKESPWYLVVCNYRKKWYVWCKRFICLLWSAHFSRYCLLVEKQLMSLPNKSRPRKKCFRFCYKSILFFNLFSFSFIWWQEYITKSSHIHCTRKVSKTLLVEDSIFFCM